MTTPEKENKGKERYVNKENPSGIIANCPVCRGVLFRDLRMPAFADGISFLLRCVHCQNIVPVKIRAGRLIIEKLSGGVTMPRAFTLAADVWDSSKDFRAFFENIPVAVIIVDGDNHCIDANDFAHQLLGLDKEQLIGANI